MVPDPAQRPFRGVFVTGAPAQIFATFSGGLAAGRRVSAPSRLPLTLSCGHTQSFGARLGLFVHVMY